MDEPEGRVYGRQAEQRPSASEAYGKPWDFLAVDWAKNQVERIDGTVWLLLERVDRLENRLTRNPGDDMAEPLEEWTERQLDKMAAVLRETHAILDQLNSTVEAIDKTAVTTSDRIGKLERRTLVIEDQYVPDLGFEDLISRVRRLESQTQFETSEDDARLRVIETALQDYGIPLGAPSKTEAFARMYGSPTGRLNVDHPPRFSKSPGWAGPPVVHTEHVSVLSDAGTLNEAEERVRQYLVGRAPNSTIVGVVRALRGDETYDGWLPLGHLFRFAGRDRRHCSFLVNAPQADKCGKLASEH